MFLFKKNLFVLVMLVNLSSCGNKDNITAIADCSQTEPIISKVIQPLTENDLFTPLRIKNLREIAIALEKYKKTNKQYPLSSQSGKEWDSLITRTGEVNFSWITGLAPEYIKELPRDPRQDNNSKHQYAYKSDGAHYKLIALNPDDCKYVKNIAPIYIDSHRAGCNYGVWTPSAKKWI